MKSTTNLRHACNLLITCFVAVAFGGGCEKSGAQDASSAGSSPTAKQPTSTAAPTPSAPTPPQREPERNAALLLSQAQFITKTNASGKKSVVPGPAKLTVVYADGGRWTPEKIEDPDANVFHKAMPVDLPGLGPGILTIGANAAPEPGTLKFWRRTQDGWSATQLWGAKFGGKFNRFPRRGSG